MFDEMHLTEKDERQKADLMAAVKAQAEDSFAKFDEARAQAKSDMTTAAKSRRSELE